MTFATTAIVNAPAAANAEQFDAPTAKAPRMKIGEFRRLVDSLNWSRSWLTGGTPDEFRKQDVPGSLAPKMAEIQAAIPGLAPRFAADLAAAESALGYARTTIDRWQQSQPKQA